MFTKTTSYFFLYFLCLNNIVQAQNFEWGYGTGSSEFDDRTSAVVNDLGEVVSVGSFRESLNLDPMDTDLMGSSMGFNDVYVEKRSATGNLIWIKFIAGLSSVICNSVSVDADGNINLLGRFFDSVDFNPSDEEAFEMDGGDSGMLYFMQLNAAGEFIWANAIDGDFGLISGESMTVNMDNEIIITGGFKGSVDFDPSDDELILMADGAERDLFVAKYSQSGEFIWVDLIEGDGFKFIHEVTIDEWNEIYIVGSYKDLIDLNPSEEDLIYLNPSSAGNGFIIKLNEEGGFIWGGVINSNQFSTINAVKAKDGYVVISGIFNGLTDFDISDGTQTRNAYSNAYSFIQKFTSEGELIWVNAYPSSGGLTDVTGLVINGFDDIIVCGTFKDEMDFDHTLASEIRTTAGVANQDGFIHQISSDGDFQRVYTITGDKEQLPHGIVISDLDELYVYGLYRNEILFEADGLLTLSNGVFDFFLMKLGGFASIKYNDQETTFQLYPNPASEFIVISKQMNETVEISDISGQIVKQVTSGNSQEFVDVSNLSKGIYFVKVSNGELTKIKKFVVS